MHKKYEDLKNNKRIAKRGFSLVEIVTTVAIIGILAGVAVPNYERIRLQMNMEMVKQHMRIIGEKLTEIIGKQGGQAPGRAAWGNPTSGDEDEVSLTATLSAIDQKGYTTQDWIPPQENLSDFGYEFLSCPKDNAWGSAGDRCYRVTPNGVEELPPGVGKWMGVNTWNSFTQTKNALDALFNASGSFVNKLNVFMQLAEYAALYTDGARWETISRWMSSRRCSCDDDDGGSKGRYVDQQISKLPSQNAPSSFFILGADQIQVLTQYLNASKDALEAKGIFIETRVQDPDQVIANCKAGCNDLANVIASTENPKGVEISFKLDNGVETTDELQARLPANSIAQILAKLKK